MTAIVPPVRQGGGLTSGEAARRLERDGENVVPRAAPRNLPGRVARQLADPMILLLCAALGVVLVLGDRVDAAIIGAVVVLNTVIGVVQEVRAEHAVAVLDELASPEARCDATAGTSSCLRPSWWSETRYGSRPATWFLRTCRSSRQSRSRSTRLR